MIRGKGSTLPRRRALRRTAGAVLPPFLWLVSGGAAHAEAESAARDAEPYLQRSAEDPRLRLSPEARERLRSAAAELAARRAQRMAAPAPEAEAQAVEELRQAADELARADQALASGAEAKVSRDRIGGLRRQLASLRQRVLSRFADVEASLATQGADPIIRERSQSARRAFDDSMRAVLGELQGAEGAGPGDTTRAALASVAERLRTSSTDRPEHPLDPRRLPFRPGEGRARAPRLTNAEFGTPASGIASPLAAATAKAAATAAPTAVELEPTDDAQITPAIQALAASLGNDPLRIYDWVRNNVEFVPTYGSVQGSQMTMVARRGNAFDIASLLVALLRSAGVGARYVLGTVEVPVDAVRNWVGGAETSPVAQQLLGQGGIPNVGLLRGATLTHIRLEHVWVEAFIDYVPSRGAAQHEGDTWVPMDASFKLHDFPPPSRLLTDVPFDMSALADQLVASGEYDPALNRIANVDQDLLFPAFQSWQSQMDAYLAANSIPRTPDGILGGQATIQKTSTVFAGSLPYTVLARGPGQAVLPPALRHYVSLRGFASPFDRILGSASFTYRVSLPQLNSRRLELRFDPATAADAAVLEKARRDNAPSLPAYLIHLLPVVTLDGTVVATGPSARMGSTQPVDVVLEGPDGPTTVPYENLIAGDEIVFGVTGNGVTQPVVQDRFAAFPPDNAAEYLHQIQLHYWMESDAAAAFTAKGLGVHMLRLPSVGAFASPLTVGYLFGSPVSAVYQSRIMDVKQSLLGAAGKDPRNVTAFFIQAGYQGSFMEGAVFDQFENEAIPQGISAVQLLADALTVGIPVYHVTPTNSTTVLPLLSVSGAVKSDIANAVAAGKTVLVPERNLDRGPWQGVGYIVQDETTGAGAYLISGGVSGGGITDCFPDLVPILVIIFAILLIAFLIWWFWPVLGPILVPAGAGLVPRFAYMLALLLGSGLATAP
jgi:transglutaminase-like putative cysteine protease